MSVKARDWGSPEQTVSPLGYDRTTALIHAWKLWLSVQDLHAEEAIKPLKERWMLISEKLAV